MRAEVSFCGWTFRRLPAVSASPGLGTPTRPLQWGLCDFKTAGIGRPLGWEVDRLKMIDQMTTGCVIDVWSPGQSVHPDLLCIPATLPARLMVRHSIMSFQP